MNFEKEFLATTKWFFDYDKIFEEDNVMAEVGPFQFLDYFLTKGV